jgi:radical SAM superfamily enzyme YgiQ (UPF0313 family)
LPVLWSQAKTYYEKNGQHVDQWHWYPCYADTQTDIEKIKLILKDAQPDIFAISLYVWNVELALRLAEWVKQHWPNCLIVSGGPQQNLKYNINWFNEHKYLDASLPGECYGELFFTELLDNYVDGQIDWNLVTDARYPLPTSRILTVSQKTMQLKDKKEFDYQWSSFATQKEELLKFINYQPDVLILVILETTRGCPYGCTYCDWGGGIATTVRKKDLDYVVKDLEFLTELNLFHLYLADANLGIFGDRDLKIIQILAKLRKKNKKIFSIGYGGFAKSDNKLSTIKEIIKIGLKNNFRIGRNFKLSIQSLDPLVLKSIDRKNINFDTLIESLTPLVKKYKQSLEIEMILGLPNINLEKFYHEIDILGGFNLSVRWYEWLLLPETPAYNPDYRIQYGLETTLKNNGWANIEPAAMMEIVVKAHSYTKENYLEMLMATSIYHAIIQGGLYSDSINWVIKNYNVKFGDIIKKIYNNYYQEQFLVEWNSILKTSTKNCLFKIDNDYQVFGGLYFAGLAFLDSHFVDSLGQLLIKHYNCPAKIVKQEQKKLINVTNSDRQFKEIIDDFWCYKTNILKRKNSIFELILEIFKG